MVLTFDQSQGLNHEELIENILKSYQILIRLFT